MKYLISGGAGFIGSHLADYLLERGHHVYIVDNLSTGRLDNVEHLIGHERFHCTVADILDLDALEPLVAQCDQIYHLAAAVGVRLIMDEPVQTIITNVQGTENILHLAHVHGKKVLLASTSEVYGKMMETVDTVTHLHEESDWTLGPTTKRRWAYACSKALDEFLALAYADEKHLPVVIARFFNTVGPRQTSRYGMVLPNFVRRALSNEPIEVFGDGEQTRCFTHVYDAVRAIVDLMDEPTAEGHIFNIGAEEEVSMNRLAERVRELTGSHADIVHVAYDEVYGEGYEDMRRRTPDISKLRAATGYEPVFSTDDIIRDVIRHYRGEEAFAYAERSAS